MMPGLYGYTEAGIIVAKEEATVKVAAPDADIVLDPVCGSGTAAEAAAKLYRRFIWIDREPRAVEICYDSLHWYVQRRTRRVEWMLDAPEFQAQPMRWDIGCNYIVRADSLNVLSSMPDSFVALVVMDPPFNVGREFRNKAGDGFSDIWCWDAAAQARLCEIEALDVDTDRYVDGPSHDAREGARRSILLNIAELPVARRRRHGQLPDVDGVAAGRIPAGDGIMGVVPVGLSAALPRKPGQSRGCAQPKKILVGMKEKGYSALDTRYQRVAEGLKLLVCQPHIRPLFDRYLDAVQACALNIDVTPESALDLMALAIVMRPANIAAGLNAEGLDSSTIGAAMKPVVDAIMADPMSRQAVTDTMTSFPCTRSSPAK